MREHVSFRVVRNSKSHMIQDRWDHSQCCCSISPSTHQESLHTIFVVVLSAFVDRRPQVSTACRQDRHSACTPS